MYNFNVNPQQNFDLLTKLSCKSIFNLPTLKKIVLSIGVKESHLEKNVLLTPFFLLLLLTGQKPVLTKAKKSIALYSLRRGMFSGIKVTLRDVKMSNFLLKFLFIVLPRNKEFITLNLNKSFSTNMVSLGVPNLSLFPEIEKQFDNNLIKGLYGCNITFVISQSDFVTSQIFLSLLGLPIKIRK